MRLKWIVIFTVSTLLFFALFAVLLQRTHLQNEEVSLFSNQVLAQGNLPNPFPF